MSDRDVIMQVPAVQAFLRTKGASALLPQPEA